MPSAPGRLVTATIEGLGGRAVSVYVPAAPAQVVVFAGDGQVIAPWGADLEATELPPTMVVGVHRVADETERIVEYALGADAPGLPTDPDRFLAHERFFVGTVRRWVAAELGVDLPADRTAVLGVSAGAELALAMGVRHPEVFGAVLACSPGAGYRPPAGLGADQGAELPRVYLLAGIREPFFLANATRWATALRDTGADVLLVQRDGAHGDPFWRAELPRMVGWLTQSAVEK